MRGSRARPRGGRDHARTRRGKIPWFGVSPPFLAFGPNGSIRWLGILSGLLAGCAPEANDTPSKSVGDGSTAITETEVRETPVPFPAQRALASSAAGLDFLAEFLPASRVVAVPVTLETYSNVAVESSDWADHSRFSDYTAEAVLPFDPDLVLTHDWQKPGTTSRLRDLGITVVKLPDVSSFDDLLKCVDMVGTALGESDKKQELLEDLRDRRRTLESTDRSDVRVLSYTNYGSGGWAAGEGTSANLMIELARLTNVAVEAGLKQHARIDLERLLILDPDFLLVSGPTDESEHSPTYQYLTNEAALQTLRAIREHRFLILPARLFNTSSHHLIAGAEELARQADAFEGRSPPRSR